MQIIRVIICIFMIFVPATAFSIWPSFNTPFDIDTARGYAIGGAFLSREDTSTPLIYNPATLALSENQISFHTLNNFQINETYNEVKFTEGSFLVSYTGTNFGAHFYYGIYGDRIPEMLCFDGIERNNIDTKIQGAVGYGTNIHDKVSAGITVKFSYIYNEVYAYTEKMNSFGAAVDLGLMYRMNKDLLFGLKLENLLDIFKQDRIARDDDGYVFVYNSVPENLSVGMSYRAFDKLIIAIDIKNLCEPGVYYLGENIYYSDDIRKLMFKREYSIGFEFMPIELYALRLGVCFREEPTFILAEEIKYSNYIYFSGGIGLNAGSFSVDIGVSFPFERLLVSIKTI